MGHLEIQETSWHWKIDTKIEVISFDDTRINAAGEQHQLCVSHNLGYLIAKWRSAFRLRIRTGRFLSFWNRSTTAWHVNTEAKSRSQNPADPSFWWPQCQHRCLAGFCTHLSHDLQHLLTAQHTLWHVGIEVENSTIAMFSIHLYWRKISAQPTHLNWLLVEAVADQVLQLVDGLQVVAEDQHFLASTCQLKMLHQFQDDVLKWMDSINSKATQVLI